MFHGKEEADPVFECESDEAFEVREMLETQKKPMEDIRQWEHDQRQYALKQKFETEINAEIESKRLRAQPGVQPAQQEQTEEPVAHFAQDQQQQQIIEAINVLNLWRNQVFTPHRWPHCPILPNHFVSTPLSKLTCFGKFRLIVSSPWQTW